MAPEAATFEAAQHIERNLGLDSCESFLSVVDLGNCRGFFSRGFERIVAWRCITAKVKQPSARLSPCGSA